MQEDSINSRIKLLITELRLNPNAFSVKIGVAPQTTSKILKGKNYPGYEYIYKILSTFSDINADWLILGVGQIKKGGIIESEKTDSDKSSYIEKLELQNASFKREINTMQDTILAQKIAITTLEGKGREVININQKERRKKV